MGMAEITISKGCDTEACPGNYGHLEWGYHPHQKGLEKASSGLSSLKLTKKHRGQVTTSFTEENK